MWDEPGTSIGRLADRAGAGDGEHGESGYVCHVYDRIGVSITQVGGWGGSVSDPMAALNLMGKPGIPVCGWARVGFIRLAGWRASGSKAGSAMLGGVCR